ncbi:MAG: hypothetical protein WCL49_05775 [bacterium]
MKTITKPKAKTTKTAKIAKHAKPKAKPKAAGVAKAVEVVQKDIPLHTLIDQVIVIYLKELVMNYRIAFMRDSYVKATTDSGTHSLHGEFYDGCVRFTVLSERLKAMKDAQKSLPAATMDALEAEALFAKIRAANLEQLEKLEQLSAVMRPGQSWRKELDAVGLGKNAKAWLAFWDEKFPKIQALQKPKKKRLSNKG